MNISEYLKKLREDKGCSINQLALYSGVSAAHISRIERGLREASPDILEKLSKSLGVSHEELMVKAGYISSDRKHTYTSDELTKLVPNEYKELFEDQNIGYVKFAQDMMKEEIDINTLKELIDISKKIKQEYGNIKDENTDK